MKRIFILATACLVLLANPCLATAAIRYVTKDGVAGTSPWDQPYSSINAAITASSAGDEIWVRGYTDGVTVYPENLSLKSGVSLKGGYTGNGSERSESYITTVFPSSGTVITASNIPASPTTLVEYLTLKNGDDYRNISGGGVNCISASPTISHCRICYCAAELAVGICADYYSSPTIEDCEIDNNAFSDAGQTAVLIYNGIFRRNKLHDNNNIAGPNGGLSVGSYGTGVTISDNHIYSNAAASSGGGIYIDGSPVTLTGNIIENNMAYWGNAIYWSKGADSGSMCNNVIKGNGGYGASAIFVDTTAATTFVNNTIIDNAGDASFKPVEISGGTLNLYNNIIANNSNYGVYTSGTIDYSYNNCLYNNGTDYNVIPSYIQQNISSAPGFAADGYHLASSSACIDAGYDSAPGLQSVDMDIEPRQVDIDGFGATGVKVDIGADEYYPDYKNSPMVDDGLPSTDLNLGPNRSNIRWAKSTEVTVGYGDDFTLPAGPNWVINKITVWAVPDIPSWPEYYMGDHYLSVALYGGAVGSALSSIRSGAFSTGSNDTDNSTISVMAVSYADAANPKYQAADGSSQQLWKIDFNNLDWIVTGGTSYAFGVIGVPRVDRLWFNHATHYTSKGDGQIRAFDTTDLAEGASLTNGNAWFGGKGSDINVQIYAHPQ